MNKQVKIRYDVMRLEAIDGEISTEVKTVFIGSKILLTTDKNISSTLQKWSNWLKRNIDKKQVNAVITLFQKIKKVTGEDEYKEEKSQNLSVYDLTDNNFMVIENFSYEDHIDTLLYKNKQKEVGDNTHSITPQKYSIPKEILIRFLTKFIETLSFEYLSGGNAKYKLQHIYKKIFNENISIIVIPTEKYDDQGYVSTTVSIIEKGRLNKIFSLNENSHLHPACVGGFVAIDEFRKPKIKVDNVIFSTQVIEPAKVLENQYQVYDINFNPNGFIFLHLRDTKNCTYQITESIDHFLDRLLYVENQEIYYVTTRVTENEGGNAKKE